MNPFRYKSAACTLPSNSTDGTAETDLMINRIVASLIHRLDLPFQYSSDDGSADSDRLTFTKLKRELKSIPRYVPGTVSVADWKLTYVDAPALVAIFEIAVVKRWHDFIAKREDPLILDCGANIGVTVLHFKHLYPKATIVAFEPDKEICKVLRKNLTENAAQDVEVVEAAVWTTTGQHSFVSEGADGSRLAGEELDSLAVYKRYEARTVRLAEYLDKGHVDFIKLDIEGAETEVILDCADRLRNVDSMVIEFHLMNNSPQSIASLFQTLSDVGFNVAVNCYPPRVDLTRRPTRKSAGDLCYDQYLDVCAWRQ